MGPVVVVVAAGLGACDSEELPACPGQCFEYTVEHDVPTLCLKDNAVQMAIPFTGTDPVGYQGRICSSSPGNARVLEAIDHLRGGGSLSDLEEETVAAYLTKVTSVRSNLYSECLLAAPGQCINTEQVCWGIAADAYDQLLVEQTCTLRPDGVEPVELGPGESCLAVPGLESTGTPEPVVPCTESSGSGGADETTG